MDRRQQLKQFADEARRESAAHASSASTVQSSHRPTALGHFADDLLVHRSVARPGKIAKTQIIDMVADKTGLNKKQSSEAVAAMLDVVVGSLRGGQSVGLPGLGTFSVANTAARTGVRPGTNQKITIPAGKKVRFKVASTLKAAPVLKKF